jgi:hypothetical protein
MIETSRLGACAVISRGWQVRSLVGIELRPICHRRRLYNLSMAPLLGEAG